MNNARQADHRNGFSLIELLSAIVVHVIVIIATTSAISHHLVLLRTNTGFLRGRLAAIREMERIKNLTWANLPAVGSGALFPTEAKYGGQRLPPELLDLFPDAQGVTYVCWYHPNNGAYSTAMRQVIVMVRLDNTAPSLVSGANACNGSLPAPNPKIIQLTTLISQYSPLYP